MSRVSVTKLAERGKLKNQKEKDKTKTPKRRGLLICQFPPNLNKHDKN
jgi:hypothetical protein